MSLVQIYRRAWQTLGIEPGVDRRGLRRAYRRKTRAHPPDRDPEAYAQIRHAYDLLNDDEREAEALLNKVTPQLPPPRLLNPQVEPGATALALLRHIAATLEVDALLAPEPTASDSDDEKGQS